MKNTMGRREALKFSIACSVALGSLASASKAKKDSFIIIKNATIFNGMDVLDSKQDILIKNNVIESICNKMLYPRDSIVIEANNKFVMPGLIDCHWHVILATGSPDMVFNTPDPGLLYSVAIKEAERTLLRGFTTVRDMAGSVFGIKKAIDNSIFKGPRIYPSGAFISQTAGHGDFNPIYNKPRSFGDKEGILEEMGEFRVADGIPEALTATREQLKKGATQIKIGASGGVVSDFDPLDSTQFSLEEMKAIVNATSDWGTYVCAHAYSDNAIKRCIDSGVKSIEHGQLASPSVIERMADSNTWLSLQPFEYNKFWPDPINEKDKFLNRKWRKVLEYAIKYGVNCAFGSDAIFDPVVASGQNHYLTMFAEVLGNLGALRMATSGNATLVELSGNRNPYKDHKLGRIEPNAWADLIIVDGNPIKDISLIKHYDTSFKVIIKNGEIAKNIL